MTLKKKPRLSAEERAALTSLYDDGIRHVDAGLERIFRRLEEGGWLANTLVVVTSDHGESLAQRGNKLTGHGGPWQEGVRVPLIVRLPDRARAGERLAEPTHLIDVPQTVLDFTGLGIDPELPGHSLLRPLPAVRILAGGDHPAEFYVRWPEKALRYNDLFGVFDLEQDPGELAPRELSAADFQALRQELGEQGLRTFAPIPAAELTPEERSELSALGYGGVVDEDEDH
ncbi:MAG TPA: sulfatase-like hydrolase/transferase [Planctomycetota bacterium]